MKYFWVSSYVSMNCIIAEHTLAHNGFLDNTFASCVTLKPLRMYREKSVVGWWVMFRKLVCIIVTTFIPVDAE